MNKLLVAAGICVAVFAAWYVFDTVSFFSDSEKLGISVDGGLVVVAKIQNPVMGFGTATREIRIYTSFYFFLGKCNYGEYPLELIRLSEKQIELMVTVFNDNDLETVRDRLSRNPVLGPLSVKYTIKRASGVEEPL